ncbi:MAG TPA: DUF503 domain-containing protein, partial [Anaerolineaceae bacterium]|nr:DUF503 domain-containing protein [Anaerolineaceae bacterium]
NSFPVIFIQCVIVLNRRQERKGMIFVVDAPSRIDYSKDMVIGLLTLHLRMPGCHSLKEKRSQLQPILARLHRDFNISAAETDLQDRWQESVIACAMISNDSSHNQRVLQQVLDSVEQTWLNVEVIDHCIEMV